MQTLHLFAGAGGGLLADLILGHTPIGAVEFDPYCCRVLRERAADGWFPELRVHEGDVRLFDPSEYAGRVDCIHAGFPCQDISVAGKQAGIGEETRSGLYREVLRIAGVVRPRYLFLENVSAIVSNGLGTVLADLIALGYDSEWLCLRASDCGANHQRDRWWLLATHADSSNGSAKQERQHEWAEESCGSCAGEMGPSLADSDSTGLQAWNETGNCGQKSEGIYKGSQPERVHTEAVPQWWEVEPNVGRVANGVASRTHRLKALGNAQVPLQAALAWKILGGPIK